jgi:hypothetical protein
VAAARRLTDLAAALVVMLLVMVPLSMVWWVRQPSDFGAAGTTVPAAEFVVRRSRGWG